MSADTTADFRHGADLASSPLDEVAVRESTSWCRSRRKRAFDIAAGVGSLLIVIPLIGLLSTVSLIAFRANPFFRQHRRGVDEVDFTVLKIRSLPKSFPERQGKHHIEHHEFDGWSGFLRNSHLDELPQVFNIIGGTMSVVGPRPMIDIVVDELEPIDRKTRAQVRPGLTGPWQISTMGAVPLHDHPELDNAYVEQASFRSDMRIIWITFLGVLGAKPLEPSALMKRLRWRS